MCCPSCTGRAKKVGTKFMQCEYCGYMAPKKCFESVKENAIYRLQFESAIFAEKAEDSEAFLRRCAEEEINSYVVEARK